MEISAFTFWCLPTIETLMRDSNRNVCFFITLSIVVTVTLDELTASGCSGTTVAPPSPESMSRSLCIREARRLCLSVEVRYETA